MSCSNCLPWIRLHPIVLRLSFLFLFIAVILSLLLHDGLLSRLLFASEDAERQLLLAQNEERIQRSEHFLYSYRKSLTPDRILKHLNQTRKSAAYLTTSVPEEDQKKSETVPEIGITVLTMSRGGRMKQPVSYKTHYLTQSIARLLQFLNDTRTRRTYRLAICNVDTHPDTFQEAGHFESILPFFRRYDRNGVPVDGMPDDDTWEKLKHDYVFCLDQTLLDGVRYALLVEDDSIAHPQLLQVLEHMLDSVLEKPGAANVTYVKLFHPKRLLGYVSLEVERLTELLALSLTLGAVLTLLCFRCAAIDGSETGRLPVKRTWMWWSLAVSVAALLLGRTNLLELRRLSPQLYQITPAPSCCTPAMFYTQQGAKDIINHLNGVRCTSSHSTDIRMEEFRQKSGARALLVQPNLFTHIGMVSALRTTEVNPLIVS